MNPSTVGALAEREVAVALMRTGWSVFTPLFEPHGRVDLIALRGGEPTRVQVKSGRPLRDDTFVGFKVCSNTDNSPSGYGGEIDAFGVWVPRLCRAYLVPISDVAHRFCHLRLTGAANGQRSGVRFAHSYAI